jgi:hypothetical protein
MALLSLGLCAPLSLLGNGPCVCLCVSYFLFSVRSVSYEREINDFVSWIRVLLENLMASQLVNPKGHRIAGSCLDLDESIPHSHAVFP